MFLNLILFVINKQVFLLATLFSLFTIWFQMEMSVYI